MPNLCQQVIRSKSMLETHLDLGRALDGLLKGARHDYRDGRRPGALRIVRTAVLVPKVP